MLSLHPPSVAADRRQLQTIQLQQNREQEKIVKVARLRFYPKTITTGFPALSCCFARILIYRLSLNCYELHQESLHCHQLEEELDWCHCRYFQNGMGLSCCSPDSWCRRFNVDNASLKSERFLNGPVFPDLLREIHQLCLYRKYSDCVM